jgi:hypothetical protein
MYSGQNGQMPKEKIFKPDTSVTDILNWNSSNPSTLAGFLSNRWVNTE